MTSLNLADLAKQAGKTGLLDDGHYSFLITGHNVNKAQNSNTLNVGYFCKVLGGPDDGRTTWLNQNIGDDNVTGTGIWLGILDTLGVDSTFSQAPATTIEQIGEAVVGRAFEADVSTREGKKGGLFQTFKQIRAISVNGQAPAPAPAPPVAVAPVAAPVPVAAAVVPSPATAAAPVEPTDAPSF